MQFSPIAVEKGTIIVDSSAFQMVVGVLLVILKVNPEVTEGIELDTLETKKIGETDSG